MLVVQIPHWMILFYSDRSHKIDLQVGQRDDGSITADLIVILFFLVLRQFDIRN